MRHGTERYSSNFLHRHCLEYLRSLRSGRLPAELPPVPSLLPYTLVVVSWKATLRRFSWTDPHKPTNSRWSSTARAFAHGTFQAPRKINHSLPLSLIRPESSSCAMPSRPSLSGWSFQRAISSLQLGVARRAQNLFRLSKSSHHWVEDGNAIAACTSIYLASPFSS